MQVAFYMAMDLDQAFGGYAAFDLQAFGDCSPFVSTEDGRPIATIEHDAFPFDAEHCKKAAARST